MSCAATPVFDAMVAAKGTPAEAGLQLAGLQFALLLDVAVIARREIEDVLPLLDAEPARRLRAVVDAIDRSLELKP